MSEETRPELKADHPGDTLIRVVGTVAIVGGVAFADRDADRGPVLTAVLLLLLLVVIDSLIVRQLLWRHPTHAPEPEPRRDIIGFAVGLPTAYLGIALLGKGGPDFALEMLPFAVAFAVAMVGVGFAGRVRARRRRRRLGLPERDGFA